MPVLTDDLYRPASILKVIRQRNEQSQSSCPPISLAMRPNGSNAPTLAYL